MQEQDHRKKVGIPTGLVVIGLSLAGLWVSTFAAEPGVAFLLVFVCSICLAAEFLGLLRAADHSIAKLLAARLRGIRFTRRRLPVEERRGAGP